MAYVTVLWTAAGIAITSGRPVDTSDVIVISQPAIGWRLLHSCWQMTVALWVVDRLLYLQQIINLDALPATATNLLTV